MKNKIQFWLERRRIHRQAIADSPILGLKEWMKRLSTAVAIVILALVLAIAQQYRADIERENDREKEAAKQEENRIDRAIETCFNYNEDQTNDRQSFIEMVPQLAINFFETTKEEADALLTSGGGKAFSEFISTKNPYRQCSRDCVIAHTTPGEPRCEPAINEQGDPPQH